MHVLALYDIHGNVNALEAVLADGEAAEADLAVVGGDAVPGPSPAGRTAPGRPDGNSRRVDARGCRPARCRRTVTESQPVRPARP